jgi:eukaryotic-like serine/threonine-protein kinase
MAVADPFGLIGQIIDGQLRVDQVIGEGGFSIVYKGEHLGLGEPVAIKCLKLPRRLDPKLAEAFGKRFRDEGRLLYRLSQGSLYICRSITSGTTIAPMSGMLVPYMALEWLDGHSLVQEFRERRSRGKMPLSLEEAIKLFDPAVQALAYAHSQGVVHRDVKPGNLIYTQTREGPKLKVLDFGLAKIFDDEAIGMTPSVQTAGNFYMCSPSYGAPEQFDSRVGPVGPWTDVYAIALVFVESLADQKARHADSMAEGAILALNPATKPTPRSLGVNVPDAVEAILARAVALKPGDRPQTCGEFWGALKEAVRGPQPAGDLGVTVLEDPKVVEARVQLAEVIAGQRPLSDPPRTEKLPLVVTQAFSPPPVTQRLSSPLPSQPPPEPQRTLPMDASPAWKAARDKAMGQVAAAQAAQAAQAHANAQAAVAPTMMASPTPLPPPPQHASSYPPEAMSPFPPPAPLPASHSLPVREQYPSFGEPSRAEPRKKSRATFYLGVTLVVLVLMAAAAWGGYVLVKRHPTTPPRVGLLEDPCPSSPT